MTTERPGEGTLEDAGSAIRAGAVSAVELVQASLDRIATVDHLIASVIEVNADALDIARGLDQELQRQGPRGPMHGVPVLIKDNIDTADSMKTTAGSLALMDSRPRADATCVRRLREAGAVIVGKTNLSEWANFRSTNSTSGWSARGGQTRNPHVLDRSPCGSSSGSAAAVAAGLTTVALGTETDGSVVCPSSVCGVVGVKPTLGLVSTGGVIPIARSQDVVGVHARTVKDAATLLAAITGDGADGQGLDYLHTLRPGALAGVRIGVMRQQFCGYSPAADALFDNALQALSRAGASLTDPALLPSAAELATSEAELTVLRYEFHAGLDEYLVERGQPGIRSLRDVVEFNRAHADMELRLFAQEHMDAAVATGGLDDPRYLAARRECVRLAGTEGIDAVLEEHALDALVSITAGPAWLIDHFLGDHVVGGSSGPAAMAGYPAVTVPMGAVAGALPVGISFIGPALSEARLLAIAHAFELAVPARTAPRFLPTLGQLA